MNLLFKALLIASPLIAITFYYIVLKQEQIDTQIHVEDTRFERDFNEFSSALEKDPDLKAKYQARAAEAEAELEELEPEVKKSKDKSDKFSTEFDKAMDEFEQMQKKGDDEK